MSDGGLMVVLCTYPDRAAAETAARHLVDAGLAVCAQVGADLVSFYRWGGEVKRDAEVAVVLKVLPERYDLCVGELRLQHPYDTPQVVAMDAARVDAAYLAWARGREGGKAK
jgi:periplasmic divalent cation tolerance protein